MIRFLGTALACLLLAGGSPAYAAVDFETSVAPILHSSCLGCHGERAALGGVRLHIREGMGAKASFGQVVTPGDPERSALYVTLTLAKGNPKAMPPMGPLSDEQKAIIRQWILEGAAWPDGFVVGGRKTPAAFNDDLALVEAARPRIAQRSRTASESAMQAYTEAIPATDVALDFVPIPGGTFSMGAPGAEKGRSADEEPAHRVQVDPFWMSKFETTWDAYRLFMIAQQASEEQNSDAMVDAVSRPTAPYVEMSFGMGLNGYPAISMTQHAANKFAQWLSLKTGHFYRLPTEAEWEYACRAGASTAYAFGDDPAQLGDYAWFGGNSEGKYQKVGTKKPNAWGLYDMHGNVVEWTLDQYDEIFYGKGGELALNPWNKAVDPYPHVARGGGWADDPARLRCGARLASSPEWKFQDPQLPKSIWYHTDAQWLGFRLVRPLKLPSAKEMFAYWNNEVEYD
ncbi:MAG: SUMF1/EgtB/PvdO family nonheme iron enzyme [Bryobacterales bacterium]|nr:SUMF1/EgtB/PvdO family nonheme iron enzyme [Bryobacterales bacterium]